MIHSTPFAERVRKAFNPTPRGVVGLVDDLLGLCRTHQLRMNFQDGHCRIRRLGTDSKDSLDLAVPKSVFRAVLARIAALCNERHPHSVTPYRGEGEVAVPAPLEQGNVSRSTCYVAFTNTPSDQRLELRFSRYSVSDETKFTVLFRDNRTVTVFGHTANYVPTGAGYGVFKIISRSGSKPAVVAVFSGSEVIAVFSGDLHEPNGGTEQAEPHAAPDPARDFGSGSS